MFRVYSVSVRLFVTLTLHGPVSIHVYGDKRGTLPRRVLGCAPSLSLPKS